MCVRVCVKMMTSEVCGIDFRGIIGYRYSCRLVQIIIAMQICHVYLLGTHRYIHREKQLSCSFVQGNGASVTNKGVSQK